MIHFECDYAEGCCQEILDALSATNLEQTSRYGEDVYCQRAREKIKELCNTPEAQVFFLSGGTQANLTVISAALRPHQGVISPDSGHISVHETGAIEACGHKVISLPSKDGKLTVSQIEDCYNSHWNDSSYAHMVQPAMVYISFPTEGGLLYTLKELEEISSVCKKCNLLLFVDGARMGYGLASPANDCSLEDFGRLCDVFYIGGTKVGALFGEAVVITNKNLQRDFNYIVKQKGGLLAKGRVLGIQFDTLFTNNLYFEISKKAINFAMQIKQAFEQKEISFLFESPTNQQFPVLNSEQREKLGKKYFYTYWQQLEGDMAAIRLCTSWATTQKQMDMLLEDIASL